MVAEEEEEGEVMLGSKREAEVIRSGCWKGERKEESQPTGRGREEGRERTHIVFGLRDRNDCALKSVGDSKEDPTEGIVLFDEARAGFFEVGESEVGDPGRLEDGTTNAFEGRTGSALSSTRKEGTTENDLKAHLNSPESRSRPSPRVNAGQA